MISNLLLEAALRSAFLALAVWIGLRVFAVRNVLAQKAAWGLVLASAVMMPLVLPVAARVPGVVIPSAAIRSIASLIPQPSSSSQVLITAQRSSPIATEPAAIDGKLFTDSRTVARFNSHPKPHAGTIMPALDRYSAPVILHTDTNAVSLPQPDPAWYAPKLSLLQIAGLLYLAIAGILVARLLYGLIIAIHVWNSAKPVLLDPSALTRGLHLRFSDYIPSPVTIGSAVVLPADYREWDAKKLRIVLAHERSHVRQGDFYLQLLAGVYAAVVWFSPLGWWLKRKLSDLAEAISDRAGLEEAADRTSYAQVLLEFAAAPRPTVIGVAMARSGSLSRRIERLLNDASFRQAFAGTRRSLAAVLVIPVALFAASALVRVQAQVQAPTAPPPPSAVVPVAGVPQSPPTPAAPSSEISDPYPPASPELASAPPEFPAPAGAPQAAPTPPSAPAEPPALMIVPIAPHPGALTLIAPKAPHGMAKVLILPPPAAGSMAIIAPRAAYGAGYGAGYGQSTSTETGTVVHSEDGKRSGYRYSYSSNGDSYAIIRGNGQNMSFSGDWIEGRREQLEKARKQAGGKDILWFTRNGKSYFVDDPSTLSQIEAMYKPMEELGHQQEELGKRQEALGKQQEELGKQQESASVPTPDMSREIAEIDKAMAKLKANQGKNMNQEEAAEMQERLAELQARLGEMQGQIGSRQGEFGARMGELGERMGELGAQQGRLGSEQGRIAGEADRKVKSIIDESLQNGKAHPLQ
ncbi:MAG TPA: M56 family metallopeptidase [Terracidiphilus sp.]|jgi:beta-lactamase regulating signal transducer with metallopeptidase domain